MPFYAPLHEEQKQLIISNKIVLLHGQNKSGKTSLMLSAFYQIQRATSKADQIPIYIDYGSIEFNQNNNLIENILNTLIPKISKQVLQALQKRVIIFIDNYIFGDSNIFKQEADVKLVVCCRTSDISDNYKE